MNIKSFFLIVLIFSSQSIAYSRISYNDIDLGANIKITQKEYTKLEDSIETTISFLNILESNDLDYKYILFDKFHVTRITKDSVRELFFFGGDFYNYRNYYNDFDKPVSSYIYFIENRKNIDSLTVGIEKQSTIHGETDSSYFTLQNIHLDNLNLDRSLYLEWAKNGKDFFRILKTASQNGVNLSSMWQEVVLTPSTNDEYFSDVGQNYLDYLERVKSNKERKNRKNNNENKDSIKSDYVLKGINTEDSKFGDLFSGKNYLLVYIWGIWCGPCELNTPNVIELFKNLDDKYSFVSLNCEVNEKFTNEEILKYISIKEINYNVYYGCQFIDYYGIKNYPNLLVFNKNLELIDNFSGYVLDVNTYVEFLNEID